MEIVELILEFNQLNQEGKRLKISTPSQMLSRLPISLAQLKAGKILRNSKTKLGKLCTDKKKNFITVWLTLFKHGNNLYEH